MISQLSYRIKTPLALMLVIVVTSAVVATAVIWQGYQQAREQFLSQAQALGRTLARALRAPLLHDDTWQAYEMLLTPLDQPNDQVLVLILVDSQRRIFASSAPHLFGVFDELAATTNPELFQTLGEHEALAETGGWLFLITPVRAPDGTLIGHLIQRYTQALLPPSFTALVERVLLGTVVALLLLLPLGWAAGKQLAEPLSHLADCLSCVGKNPAAELSCLLPKGNDEIGRLAQCFQTMVAELNEKSRLEAQLALSERLAALGRLAAAIAHEINNPLGGMLNAISNFRRRGSVDPAAIERMLALLERGLHQIRETVAALLAEARVDPHPLTAADFEDVRTLVLAEIQRKAIRFDWQIDLSDSLPLPAAPVRQIVLNLLLNAVAATPVQGLCLCIIKRQSQHLQIEVANEGEEISAERRAHLFEPVFGTTRQGEKQGLGLWITYQLTRQLHGQIAVSSTPGWTVFTVTLPLSGIAPALSCGTLS